MTAAFDNAEQPSGSVTFDEAFNSAARVAVGETVEDHPRTWLQKLRLARRDRWRPTPAEREKAVEACRVECRDSIRATGELPSVGDLKEAAGEKVGSGLLTMLWVAVMVAKLLDHLSAWWKRK